AGGFNVLGGWFITALVAFTVAGLAVVRLRLGGVCACVGIMVLVGILLYRRSKRYNSKVKQHEADLTQLQNEDMSTIKEMISESSSQIAKIVSKTNSLYSNVVNHIALQDLTLLKEDKKKLKKLEKEVDELKSNVFYIIKDLDEGSLD